jgi:hypothetical protein
MIEEGRGGNRYVQPTATASHSYAQEVGDAAAAQRNTRPSIEEVPSDARDSVGNVEDHRAYDSTQSPRVHVYDANRYQPWDGNQLGGDR